MTFSPFRKNCSDTIILDVQLEDILEEKSLFNEEELRKSKELCAEEAMLRKEIHELETTEIEVNILIYIVFCMQHSFMTVRIGCHAGKEKEILCF
jgi:hypothetical protein